MFSDYLSHDSPATYLYAIFAVLVFKKKKIFYVAARCGTRAENLAVTGCGMRSESEQRTRGLSMHYGMTKSSGATEDVRLFFWQGEKKFFDIRQRKAAMLSAAIDERLTNRERNTFS